MPILVATDLSDTSRILVDLGVALGEGRDIELMYVCPSSVSPDDRERLRAALAAEAQRVREATGCAVREVLDVGDVATSILAHAYGSEAKLIALGARTSQAAGVGSVAERVCQSARVPVLAARLTADTVPAKLRVFVGIDFTPASLAALAWAKKHTRAEIVLAHVWSPSSLRDRLGLPLPVDPQDPDPRIEAAIVRDLRAIPGAEGLELAIAPIFPRESSADALLTLAAAKGADVLVLGAHQRRGLDWIRHGTAVGEALRKANLTIVAFPDRADSHPIPALSRVVCATDFSDVANQAIPHAYALAGTGGFVHLCTVSDRTWASVAEVEARDAALIARLQRLVPTGANERGITTVCHALEHPEPAKAVTQQAERVSAHAIVVGGTPHSAVYDLAVGSFVHKLLEVSTRPVFVVHPQD